MIEDKILVYKAVNMYLVSVDRQEREIDSYCKCCKELIEHDLHINDMTFKGCLKEWCSHAAKEVQSHRAAIGGAGYKIVFRKLGAKRNFKLAGGFSSKYKGVSFDKR